MEEINDTCSLCMYFFFEAVKWLLFYQKLIINIDIVIIIVIIILSHSE